MKELNTLKLLNTLILLFFLLTSCDKDKSRGDIEIYDGKVGELILKLDSLTPSYMSHFQIVEENTQKLLYALSPLKNRFQVFDLSSGDFIKSFSYESTEKQPISLGGYRNGFFYHSKDSIFLVSATHQVFLGKENGEFFEILNMNIRLCTSRQILYFDNTCQ